jgi:hypothetical protein
MPSFSVPDNRKETRQSMQVSNYLVTHCGGAHMDDVISTAMVLAHDNTITSVFRRPETKAELDSPKIWVLDQGRRHQPELRNFDHHQFPGGTEECTISLLAQYFKLEKWMKTFHWYRPAVLLDSLGAYKAAEQLDCPSDMVTAIYTPADEYFIRLFQEREELHCDEQLFQILKEMGQGIFDNVEEDRNRSLLLEEKATLETINGVDIVYFLEDVPETTRGITSFAQKMCKNPGVCVTRDSRGDGWSLQRLLEHENVDFCQIRHEEESLFVHNTGFVAKVSFTSMDRVKELLAKSIIPVT